MKRNLIKFLRKNQDIIAYLFFGLCTTIANVAAYYICAYILGWETVPATAVAWFISVVFAYLTNRKWVFHSKASDKKEIAREVIAFFACRALTGVLDIVIMTVFVDALKFPDMVMKIISNFIVVATNYVASKLIIFKQKSAEKN